MKEDIYDNEGTLIQSGQNLTNGSVSTNGSSRTNVHSETTSTGSKDTSGKKVEEAIFAGDDAVIVPDPGEYKMRQFDYSPYREMWKRAEERRNARLQSNLSQQDLERRRNKYLAWTDFGRALGELGGVGYAPVEKREPKRALASYEKLDALRKEYDAINNADDLSWIQKLAYQDKLAHDIREQKAYDAQERERQRIALANQRAQMIKAGKITNSEGHEESNRNSITDTESNTLSSSFRNIMSNTVKYGSPEWESILANIRGLANSARPIVRLGKENDLPIDRTQALDMVKQVQTVVDAVNGKAIEPINGYYVTPDGVQIPAETLKAELGRLRTLSSNLMGTLANGDDEKSELALASHVKMLDKLTGYAFRNYFANQNGFNVTAPVNPIKKPSSDKPGFTFKNGSKPKLF